MLVGETAPRGTGKVVAPLTFLRGVLCLDSHYRAPRQVPVAAGGRLRAPRLHDAQGPVLQAAGAQRRDDRRAQPADARARSRGARRAHPQAHADLADGVRHPVLARPAARRPLARQAEFQAISERIAYDNPRVASFSQYLLRDDPKTRKGPAAASSPRALPGLRVRAASSPTASASRLRRLPPAAVGDRARRARVSIWGRVRPATAATTRELQYRDRAGWSTLRDRQHAAAGRSAARLVPHGPAAGACCGRRRTGPVPRAADPGVPQAFEPASLARDGDPALAPAPRRGRAARRAPRPRTPLDRARRARRPATRDGRSPRSICPPRRVHEPEGAGPRHRAAGLRGARARADRASAAGRGLRRDDALELSPPPTPTAGSSSSATTRTSSRSSET